MSAARFHLAAIILGTLGSLALAASAATAQPADAQAACAPGRTVEVSGSGAATAQPDRAVVRIGVETEGDTAQAALEANSRAMGQAIAAAKQAGVPAAAIQTQTVRLHARYGEAPRTAQGGATRQIVGYTAVNTVQVQIDELSQLGTLLDRVVNAGANTIEGVDFEVRDPAALLDEARTAAWEDALHKAEQLAKLAGARLGEVLSIGESSRTPRPVMAASAMAKSMAVPIEAGTQTISAEVHVSWRLLPE
jgi:uncharacterized protein